MSDPKDYADLLGCTIVALDDSREQIRKLEAEVQRLEHTVNYWKIEAKTDHERWERQMEENARLRSDIKALEKDSLAANVLRLGNEVRDLAAENTRLKAEVERSTTQYNSIIDHQLAVIEGKQAEIDRLNAELFTCSCANANMNKHMNDNARLKAEVERLRKAGDAMAKRTEFFQKRWDADELCQEVEAWNAAKEGKQP